MDRSALRMLAYKTNGGLTTAIVAERALALVDEFLDLHTAACPVASVPWFAHVLAKLPDDPEGVAVALCVLCKYVRERDLTAAAKLYQISSLARVLWGLERELREAERPRRTEDQKEALDVVVKQILAEHLEVRIGYGVTVEESELRDVLL
jgi:hypothetical protein